MGFVGGGSSAGDHGEDVCCLLYLQNYVVLFVVLVESLPIICIVYNTVMGTDIAQARMAQW